MARGFGSTFGAGSTDAITSATTFAWPTTYSFSAWVYLNGTGGGTRGRVFDTTAGAGQNETIIAMNALITTISYQTGSSTLAGQFIFNAPGTGVWAHLLITYNGTSLSNVPAVYINGVSRTVTTGNLPTGVIDNGTKTFYVGNNAAATRNWDGMLAYTCLWKDISLNASQAQALAAGEHPLLIRPENIIFFTPLDGVNNPEFNFAGAPATVTASRLGSSQPPQRTLAPIPWIDSALTVTQIIACSIAAYQAANYAALDTKMAITAAIAAYQKSNFGDLSVAEAIGCSLIAWQKTDFGALSADEAVGVALHAFQRTDYAALSAHEVAAAVIDAFQKEDFGALSGTEILQAIIAAYQDIDYATTIFPPIHATATLEDSLVYSAALADSLVYTALVTDTL